MLNATREHPVAVFNWGVPATGPVTYLLHLRQLLADGHRPALVLLEIHVPTFAKLPGGPLESFFVNGAQFNKAEIEWLASYDFPADRLHREHRKVAFFPWTSLRFPLVGRVWPSLLPFGNRYDWSRNTDEYGWRPVLLGSVTPEQHATAFARAAAEYRNTLAAMTLGDAQVSALRDLISLCREQGIRLAFLRMPESMEFRALYSHATSAQVDQLMTTIAAESGCNIVNAREWMPDDAFVDGHHMMRDPTAAFTDRLTREAITPHLDAITGPRR
ncbi:MAG: hypothetical protein C0467_28490 [Planctomycetaceae bacterium]|nr:hypothetical protein [Planctomycetaceae bacterium]